MADKIDNRPFWRKKTTWGIVCSITGAVLALTPGAPIVFAIATIPVTTAMLSALLVGLGSALGSFGAATRADKTAQTMNGKNNSSTNSK